MKIPVLTYHAQRAPDWTYASNDHLALEDDLKTIRRLGFRIVSLSSLASALGNPSDPIWAMQKLVGVSFDDGTDSDFYDFSHPDYGHLKSMARILRENAFDLSVQGGQANATSFVIASPVARAQLDRTCIAGRGQWRDLWWYEANQTGVLSIANHSWDHLHDSLDTVAHSQNARGNFSLVTTLHDANAQILQAQEYIDHVVRANSCKLFAYPYGHTNAYLTDEYFPNQTAVHAAFQTGGQYVEYRSSVWAIPRFVCNEHWQSVEQLEQILAGANPA
jgi:peptidoglycan/xylan/chitin deacetylase (PgdA/CDA1 family)